MKRKNTFVNIFTKTDFRKIVNYHLAGRGKVKRFISFTSRRVIFSVITFKDDMLFSIDTNFNFSDAKIKDGLIISVWSCEPKNLKYLINEVEFFNRDLKSKIKMNYPDVKIKLS